MPMKIRKSKNEHIDEGTYKAVVTAIQQKEGNFGNYYIWTFLVKGAMNDEKPIEGKARVTGLTSETFSENSKMYKWARACGLDVESDEIDLDDAVKAMVRITLEDDEDKDGRVWSKVIKVRSAQKATGAAEAKPAKKPKVEEEEAEEADEDAQPAKATKKPVATKPAKKEVEEEEAEEEEEEEDTPPPPKKVAKKEEKKIVKKQKEEEEEDDSEELFDFGKEDDEEESAEDDD